MSTTFMSAPKLLLTSESVTEGHPDKVCDQISDGVLDAIYAKDPMARVACETAATTGFIVSIKEQSPDIAQGVNDALEVRGGAFDDPIDKIGAGDQGMMIGFACNETPEFMPLTISLAHQLCKQLAVVRKNGTIPYLGPDSKSQVTVEYSHGKPVRVHTVVVSTQHLDSATQEQIHQDVTEHVIKAIVPASLLDKKTKIFINPTGRFVVGGPLGDAGLTGRRIIVDTYGGIARHGGGAFSGKDPTKVDRSASYAARYVAKNIVAAGLADRFEIQLAYAIGVAHPISITFETFGTEKIPYDKI